MLLFSGTGLPPPVVAVIIPLESYLQRKVQSLSQPPILRVPPSASSKRTLGSCSGDYGGMQSVIHVPGVEQDVVIASS
jgi:hypothetical protein